MRSEIGVSLPTPEGIMTSNVWSHDSAYPHADATSETHVSRHGAVTNTSRWDDLYTSLLSPGTKAIALAPAGERNKGSAVGSGDACELIAEAEHAGAGTSPWAIIAPIRPDLLVVDVDGCADLIWGHLRDAIDDHAGQVAHLAASGSPDSLHVAIACPTPQSERAVRHAITELRVAERLSARDLDLHEPGQLLRLPGSASLKPDGQACTPVDEHTLRPITAIAATRRARTAVAGRDARPQAVWTRIDGVWRIKLPADVFWPGVVVDVRRRDRRTKSIVAGEALSHHGDHVIATVRDELPDTRPQAIPTPLLPQALIADAGEAGMQWHPPRAWRRRAPITPDQWHILNATVAAPQRSTAATAAAWVLWDIGLRNFPAVRWYYLNCNAFAKFRERDLAIDRADLPACASHWESIAERARTYRPPIDPSDHEILAEARTIIATWNDPTLAAAGLAVIAHRFADGHGLVARPIAKRDLSLWMHIGDSAAYRLMQRLEDAGLISCARAWADGPPQEATLWTLRVPGGETRGDCAHDVTTTPLGELLHPLWGQQGYAAGRIWSLLSRDKTPKPTHSIAQACALRVGDSSHGTLRILRQLGELGLIVRTGAGPATRWQLVEGLGLDDAAAAAGATERALENRARIHSDRSVWHAEGPHERQTKLRALQVLRARLRHDDVAGRVQGTLFTDGRTRSQPSYHVRGGASRHFTPDKLGTDPP